LEHSLDAARWYNTMIHGENTKVADLQINNPDHELYPEVGQKSFQFLVDT
ncbi:1614_t:CDS:2, partial [Ambispora leptoticha]